MVVQDLETRSRLGHLLENRPGITEVDDNNIATGAVHGWRLSMFGRNKHSGREFFPDGPGGCKAIRTIGMVEDEIGRHGRPKVCHNRTFRYYSASRLFGFSGS